MIWKRTAAAADSWIVPSCSCIAG